MAPDFRVQAIVEAFVFHAGGSELGKEGIAETAGQARDTARTPDELNCRNARNALKIAEGPSVLAFAELLA